MLFPINYRIQIWANIIYTNLKTYTMKKLLLLLLLITSCATHKTEYTFVKVLGITPTGDTILIDVNSLRPRIYNNYYRHYDNNYARPYFYNPPVIIRQPNRMSIKDKIGQASMIESTKPIVMPPTSNPPLTKPLVKDN
mgnify:FL=1